jgi:hypothetical protein
VDTFSAKQFPPAFPVRLPLIFKSFISETGRKRYLTDMPKKQDHSGGAESMV